MSRKYWSVIVDEPVKGKYIAFAHSFNSYLNLVEITKGHKAFNLMPSKQKAIAQADYWNECYLKNGTLATV